MSTGGGNVINMHLRSLRMRARHWDERSQLARSQSHQRRLQRGQEQKFSAKVWRPGVVWYFEAGDR